MKISIYIRVSTEEQAKEGYSLEVQREYLEGFAKREGLEVYKVYSDDGISGFSDRRPALQELLADAKGKKFELVLVHKIDRFSRNLRDLLNLVEQLSSCGVGFKSATELFDTTTSAGKLMFQQLGSFAEFERNRIAERVVPGMKKSVLKGNWLGSRYSPFGYDYNKEKKLLEVNEKEAGIVKMIFSKYLAGESTKDITAYLNKKAIKPKVGAKFYNKLICDILKNPLYVGKVVWNKKHCDKLQKTKKHYKYTKNDPSQFVVAQGKHQPLVSGKDFDEVQKKLVFRTRNWKESVRNREYFLGGLLTCDKCNHRYAGVSIVNNHRTGDKSKWYRCSGPYSSHINCFNRAIKENDVGFEVENLLGQFINNRPRENRWLTLTEADSEKYLNFAENAEKSAIENEEKLKNVQRKQAKLTDAWLDSLIGEDVYRGKLNELKIEEDHLKKTLAGIEISRMVRERSESYVERAKEFFEGYDEDKKEVDSFTKKQICGLLFKNIKIAPPVGGASPSKRLSFNLYEPFNSLFLEARKSQKCQLNQIIPTQNRRRSTSKPTDAR